MKKNINNNQSSHIDDHSVNTVINVSIPAVVRKHTHFNQECNDTGVKVRNFKKVLEDVARGDDSLEDAPDPSSYLCSTPELADKLDMDIPVTLYLSKRDFGCEANLQRFTSRLGAILGIDISAGDSEPKTDSVGQPSDTVADSPTSSPTGDVKE